MIYINKPSQAPPKLIEAQNSLDEAIDSYGSFSDIPEELIKNIFSGYRDNEVKDSLFNCSHQKCAYCETYPCSGYLEVEHFAPKRRYPELTLEWDNLLPSCQVCNRHKSNHDTKSEPIINPSKVDPERYFEYEWGLFIIPSEKAPDYELAERTIEICNLNRRRLADARSKILIGLRELETNLRNRVERVNESETDKQKSIHLRKLRASIDDIESQQDETENYVGLSRYYLKKSLIFNRAKEIIDSDAD